MRSRTTSRRRRSTRSRRRTRRSPRRRRPRWRRRRRRRSADSDSDSVNSDVVEDLSGDEVDTSNIIEGGRRTRRGRPPHSRRPSIPPTNPTMIPTTTKWERGVGLETHHFTPSTLPLARRAPAPSRRPNDVRPTVRKFTAKLPHRQTSWKRNGTHTCIGFPLKNIRFFLGCHVGVCNPQSGNENIWQFFPVLTQE